MKGVLLDTNLLCLVAVGRVDRAAIGGHPRLGTFAVDDLLLLDGALQRLGDLILCPQVVTETSNLLGYRQTGAQQARWRASLAELVRLSGERTVDTVEAVADSAFEMLGLTDAVLMMLASEHALTLVSDDLSLCLEAGRRRLRCLNYSYLRDGAITVDQL